MQRILIIDDEESVRESLGHICENLGYEPVLVDDPNLSLPCQANNQCPLDAPCADALIVDHFLQTTFGLSFLEGLSDRGCKVPEKARAVTSVILTTQEAERAEAMGCQVFVKPVTNEKVKDWLAFVAH